MSLLVGLVGIGLEDLDGLAGMEAGSEDTSGGLPILNELARDLPAGTGLAAGAGLRDGDGDDEYGDPDVDERVLAVKARFLNGSGLRNGKGWFFCEGAAGLITGPVPLLLKLPLRVGLPLLVPLGSWKGDISKEFL